MTQMTHLLSQIHNWRACGAGIPDGYEAAAVLEAAMDGWDWYCIEATAEKGVAEADKAAIAEIIAKHRLSCDADEYVSALWDACKRRVAEELTEEK